MPLDSSTPLGLLPTTCHAQASTRLYVHQHYEDYMFHFNTVTRTTCFMQAVAGDGLDSCFDCASEVLILAQYLARQGTTPAPPEAIRHYSRLISDECSSSGRSLELPQICMHYEGF